MGQQMHSTKEKRVRNSCSKSTTKIFCVMKTETPRSSSSSAANRVSGNLNRFPQIFLGFPGGSGVKNSPANAGDTCVDHTQFDPWVEKIAWRRKWQPTPVFLPGKSHGQRSLLGYSL